MPTVLITGGTGLIGTALSFYLLKKGYEVIILTRNPKTARRKIPGDIQINNLSFASWNIRKQTIDSDSISRADYIIHLAGAGVADRRWTKRRKRIIVESRTKSSEFMVKALHDIPNKVKAVISASAIGWYSPTPVSAESRGKRTEYDPPDPGFLGDTCRLWEQSISPITEMNIRLVKLRIGIVLSNAGGVLRSFMKPVRFGIAPIAGSGVQMISWIHIDDLCRIFFEAMTNESWQGVYNAVAPNPVSNKTLITELAKKRKGKFFLPLHIPSVLLKIILGGMSIEILKSTDVSAEKIKSTGFQFLYPTINAAFLELIRKK